MSSDETCRRVHAFLKSKCRTSSLRVPDAWVQGCVGFYQTSHSNNNNIQDLLDFVTQQWFLADFEQLNLRSLPVNLQKSALVNLAENYVLQLKYVLNIGQSAYSQHLKITSGLESNSEVSADKKIPSKWEPKSKRLLLLHLTDGSQDIQAMEYIPISHLHLDLIPGTKILIKGPVECRRGVILLRPNNVELLGGEVSDLVQSNAPENVLARLVGKPENPNPVYGSYTAQTATMPEMEQDGDDEFSSSGVSCSGGGIKGARQPQHPLRTGAGSSANPVVTASGNLNHHQQRPPSSGSRPQGALGALGALGANGREKRPLGQDNKNGPPAKKIQADPPPDMFPDDDDDILLMADMPIEADSTTFEPFEQVAVSRAISTTSLTVSSTVQLGSPSPVRPFVYLAPYVNMRRYPAGQSVCVKGFISTIRGKLEIKAGQWKLCATVNDGSAAVDVDFSPEILEKLIGHSPSSLKSMMATRDEEAKRLAQQALENAKQSLINLNCLLHIRWPANHQPDNSPVQGNPVVYRLEEIEPRHLQMLRLL